MQAAFFDCSTNVSEIISLQYDISRGNMIFFSVSKIVFLDIKAFRQLLSYFII